MTRFSTFVLTTAIVLFAVGCKSSGGGFSKREGTTSSAGVLRYPLPTNPTTLDPGKVQDGDTIDVVQQVFEGLVKWGEDNTVRPNLAQSWEVIDGGKTYVFTLKPGIKFSSGREVTADDFKYCIERNCRPAVASATAGTYLTDIIGVKEAIEGRSKEIPGIKVLAKDKLSITIDKPRPYFLGKLTYACSYVYDKDKVGDDNSDILKAEELVGTGPFKVEKIVSDSYVHLTANKEYHGGAPALERIERPVILDGDARLNAYKDGRVDMVQLERAQIEGIKKEAALSADLKYFDRPSVFYVGLNCTEVPQLRDVRVRKAIAMAIDRDRIVNEILGGVNRRADSILPPGVLGFREKTAVLPFDVAGAKKLLAEAGFPEGKGFPEIPLYYRDGRPDIDLVAISVQQMLSANLGIKLKPTKKEWGAYLKQHSGKKMETLHMRWAADYLDPENFLSTLLASYGNENKLNYRNPKFDALCKEADSSLDEAKRLKLYAEAEDIALQEACKIPIYFQKDAELIRSKVTGLRESLFGHLPHTTTAVK